MQRKLFTALAVLLVLLPAQQAVQADQARYTIQDLGRTSDGLVPTVTGVNAAGQLSGSVNTPAGSRAVRYTDGHGWEYLPGLENAFSVGNGINANGDVVGYFFNASGELRGFRFRDGAGVEEILPMDGGTMTLAFGINAAGDVVGYGDSTAGFGAFRASPGLRAVALPTLGGSFSLACGINDAGQVVGNSLTADGSQHAMRIDPGADPVDLGSFDGPSGSSAACAIDADGRVGGQAADHQVGRAFVYAGSLGQVDGFASTGSNTEGIAAGQSVGWFVSALDGTTHAFTHSDRLGSIDLNDAIAADSGWVLSLAKGVNADGQIVGEGTLNGQATTFLLTPVKDTTPPVINSLAATPSSIWPPKGQKVPVTLSTDATDDSGVMPVCTLASVTGPGAAGVDFEVTSANTASVLAIGGRTYTMNVTCVDAFDNAASKSVDVIVPPDTTAPVFASISATPSRIWPPNGALVNVNVNVVASDDVDDQPLCYLSGITSTGATADDFAIRGSFSAQVRATGGRTYTLTATCSDRAGNSKTASVDVVVPRDTTAPSITEMAVTPNAIWPPNGALVNVNVNVVASDDVDDQPLCYLSGITSTGATADDFAIRSRFSAQVRATGGRTYTLTATCSDRAGNSKTASVDVVVPRDTTAPSITEMAVTPNAIWPPNGKMVPVQVTVSATDDVDATPSCSLTSISGSTTDSVITGAFTANVRALRNNNDDDRTYVLTVTCSDRAKNKSSKTVNVTVTKNDPNYYSTGSGKGHQK
jgi:probable HAF family extracellular repeat protein